MTPPQFSLITEPWIPVLLPDGSSALVSLRQVFDGSVDAVELEGDSPTQDYAVLRVILAVFIRAHSQSTQWDMSDKEDLEDWRREAWAQAQEGAPDPVVLAYLEKHRDRFDLLHPTQPFMQVPDLATAKQAWQPVRRLIPEAEGNYFAMRSGSALDALSFAEAARWLIHVHAFDYSGIKPGVVGDPGVKGGRSYPIGTGWSGYTGGTTICGRRLRETLVLNSPDAVFFYAEADVPAWERTPDRPGQRAVPVPQGPVDLFTWQTRRVRLHHDDGRVVGCLVTNGDKVPDAAANVLDDPMTPYRYSSNKSSKDRDVFYPQPFGLERTMWRSLEPLIAAAGDVELKKSVKPGKRPENLVWLSQARGSIEGFPDMVPVRLTSMVYGPQAAIIKEVVDARLDIPLSILESAHQYARKEVIAAAAACVEAGIELGRFAGALLQAAGGEYAFQAPATDSFLASLEPAFREWLRHTSPAQREAVDAAVQSWHSHVFSEAIEYARTLVNGAGPRALVGRTVMDGEREVTYSAALASVRLRRNLQKILPLASQSTSPSLQQEVSK